MKSTELAFIEACNGVGRQVAVVQNGDETYWFLLSSYTPHDDGTKEFKGKIANQFIDSGAFTANNLFSTDGKMNNLVNNQLNELFQCYDRIIIFDPETRFTIFKK